MSTSSHLTAGDLKTPKLSWGLCWKEWGDWHTGFPCSQASVAPNLSCLLIDSVYQCPGATTRKYHKSGSLKQQMNPWCALACRCTTAVCPHYHVSICSFSLFIRTPVIGWTFSLPLPSWLCPPSHSFFISFHPWASQSRLADVIDVTVSKTLLVFCIIHRQPHHQIRGSTDLS